MPDEDIVLLGTSAFNDAARCLKRFEYRHELKLIPRPRDVRPKIRRGTWIHRCLQLWDLDQPWEPELERMADWAMAAEIEPETVQKIYEETKVLVSDYIAFWSGRRGPEAGPFETVATEVQYKYWPRPNAGLSATLDLVVRDEKGKQWIFERKSTEDLPDSDWRNIDPQTLLQYACARLGENVDIAGIIFDYVRTDPGPSVRVYKPVKTGANAGRGGRIYTDDTMKVVTPRSFEAAVPDIREYWQSQIISTIEHQEAEREEYINQMRQRMVQPDSWFQRYMVLRPDESVVETLKDAAIAIRDVRHARKTGHYQRRVAITDCRLFCPYMKLCFREYTLGRPSEALREELFVLETPELRAEGRSEDAPISGRS